MNSVFDSIIFPAEPRNEIVVGMSMEDYRKAPGLSPSDIKIAIPDLSTVGKSKGSASRLRAHLMGMTPRKQSKSLDLGTLYHSLVLDAGRSVVLNDEKREELSARRMERKVAELIREHSGKKFMVNFAEAKAFKDKNGRAPNSDEQKALIRHRAIREAAESGGLNEKSVEYREFMKETERGGALLLDASNPVHAQALAMWNALTKDSANDEARELLESIDERRKRVEVCLFCVVDVRISPTITIPVQMKARPDWIPAGDTLPDFKTAVSLDIDDFSKESIRRGYFVSMGCYLKILNLLATRLSPEVCEFYGLAEKRRAVFIGQETTAPYEAAVYECPNNHLVAGWHFAEMALMDLCRRWGLDAAGHRGAWKAFTEREVQDPYYPAAISVFITEHASGGFGKPQLQAAS